MPTTGEVGNVRVNSATEPALARGICTGYSDSNGTYDETVIPKSTN